MENADPPLRYGIFHMFRRYFFLKASLIFNMLSSFCQNVIGMFGSHQMHFVALL